MKWLDVLLKATLWLYLATEILALGAPMAGARRDAMPVHPASHAMPAATTAGIAATLPHRHDPRPEACHADMAPDCDTAHTGNGTHDGDACAEECRAACLLHALAAWLPWRVAPTGIATTAGPVFTEPGSPRTEPLLPPLLRPPIS